MALWPCGLRGLCWSWRRGHSCSWPWSVWYTSRMSHRASSKRQFLSLQDENAGPTPGSVGTSPPLSSSFLTHGVGSPGCGCHLQDPMEGQESPIPLYRWDTAPYQGHVARPRQRRPEPHCPGPPAQGPCSPGPTPAQLLGPNPGLWEVDPSWRGGGGDWRPPMPLGCLDATDAALGSGRV